MGGCMSSPKDLELHEGEEAPVESPNSPKNAEGETVAQENKEGDEKEESLVEVTETKEEIKEEKKEEVKVEQLKDEPLVTL
ncbi:PREDICTED: ATP-dependent RNA helicase DBP5-like isoform X2 [Lupinus angustifolius]|uniref:ATP-dependent RNA helicase DBP5-like isoform X2 n=1 Tax=Lupinus angustifolius TaxID=3871 RepID=UPI00092F07FC|nr:PREDICTED: ATP-dependent RNA helicase DBP5-like isoform X2 [Lupinus angustifolius]